jgi:hypothetical protein
MQCLIDNFDGTPHPNYNPRRAIECGVFSMANYNGLPPKWEPNYSSVHFDIPGGGSGRIRISALNAADALAKFNLKWSDIEEIAVDRWLRRELVNGEVVLDYCIFE